MTGPVRPYEPSTGGTVSQKIRQALCVLHADFATASGPALTSRVGFPISLASRSVDVANGAELGRQRGPALVVPFLVTPLNTHGFLSLEIPLAQSILEASFGGLGRARPGATEVTGVERKVAEGVLAVFLSRLNALWETLGECAFSLESSGLQPLPEAAFLSSMFHLTVGEVTGRLGVELPLEFVKPLASRLDRVGETGTPPAEDPKMIPGLRRKMDGVSVSVRACLAEPEFTLREMSSLEPGDVLNVGRLGAEATVQAGDVPVFKGQAGVWNGRLAVRISGLFLKGAA